MLQSGPDAWPSIPAYQPDADRFFDVATERQRCKLAETAGTEQTGDVCTGRFGEEASEGRIDDQIDRRNGARDVSPGKASRRAAASDIGS